MVVKNIKTGEYKICAQMYYRNRKKKYELILQADKPIEEKKLADLTKPKKKIVKRTAAKKTEG